MRDVKPIKDKYAEGPSLAVKESKPRYPTFRLPLDVIPEAKKWEVAKEGEDSGAAYVIEMKVRMIGLSQGRYDQSAEFEIRGIDTEDASDEDSEDAGEGEGN